VDLNKIPVGRNPPYEINVVIEVPLGGDPVKYELDKASGAMFVDRFLHTAMTYPCNYGFIPHTLAADGDPTDVLVAGRVPVVPGAGGSLGRARGSPQAHRGGDQARVGIIPASGAAARHHAAQQAVLPSTVRAVTKPA